MNLNDYSVYIGTMVSQSDPDSLAAARTFTAARYQQIYDSTLWRDSEITTTVSVNSGQQTVTLPSNFQRIIKIKLGGNELDPVDAALLIESNPSVFDGNGKPLYYEEITDPVSNAKQIKVYPSPNATYSLFLVGKRMAPALVALTDTPILRNIDNVILAYGIADMLKRQRQYAKAGAQMQEADKLLALAQSVEKDQANRPRRAKPLSVRGNTLSELVDAVSARTAQWAPDSILLIREFLRRCYQYVYDSEFWREAAVILRMTSSGEQLILPEYVDRVQSVRLDSNASEIGVSETSYWFQTNPSLFDQIGTPLNYSVLSSVGVSILPPTHETLSIISTNATDNGNVFIKGESSGIEVNETVALNGLTPVVTAQAYDTPLRISKLLTLGDVSVTSSITSILLETIPAGEFERRHMRLWVQPSPSITTAGVTATNVNFLILGKRRIRPLIQDEDTPLLRDCQQTLIDYACADLFSTLGNKEAAADARTRGDAAFKVMLDQETNQSAYEARIVPYAEPPAYSDDGFGSLLIVP